MNDLISRQAAIDAIDRERKNKHLFNTAEDGLLEARGIINTLPSAEPETIHCYDCVYYTGKDYPWGVCKNHKGAVTNKNRLCQGIDYCSWAERREGENSDT